MRFSHHWLREWVPHDLTPAELGQRLTMAGIELDGLEDAAPHFTDVVIAEVQAVTPHPEAQKLNVCQVDAGVDVSLQVVCGAPNVRSGLRAPLARVGARLPNGAEIAATQVRGVLSQGMLCSAQELGLSESSDGLLVLPQNAPLGVSLRTLLALDDSILEVDLTPNRGDCLSIAGLAREVAALTEQSVRWPQIEAVVPQIDDAFPVCLKSPAACPRYVGRVIRDVDPGAETPLWMQERLRRCGVRSLGPIVDVTNYVMLELGQPMHAFDLAKLVGGIQVRQGEPGETLALLDGQTVRVRDDVLVIADDEKPVALAGIMGGTATAVSSQTRHVFLESGFFAPTAIAGRARSFGLHTDASHRFERGVDPKIQSDAVERATALLVEIVGGKPGPIVLAEATEHLPAAQKVLVRVARVNLVLGTQLKSDEVREVLARLGCRSQPVANGWLVQPPSHRFDLTIEEDFIEEVARVHGYDRIPSTDSAIPVIIEPIPETKTALSRLQDTLVDRGYQEAITYSFVDPAIEAIIAPDDLPLPLRNPISADLAVMRTTLWSGLLKAAQHNLNRQETRIRLFEAGLRFRSKTDGLIQQSCIAGLVAGLRWPEQWGAAKAAVDFFDIKGDVEALLATSRLTEVRFAAKHHRALHPGQSASLTRRDREIGWVGALHPGIAKHLDIDLPIYLFELDLDALSEGDLPRFLPLSSFPAVRRDVAVLVDDAVTARAIEEAIGALDLAELRECFVFDVFLGKGIPEGRKSVALSLILQDLSRTLTDRDSDAVVQRVVDQLASCVGANLRE